MAYLKKRSTMSARKPLDYEEGTYKPNVSASGTNGMAYIHGTNETRLSYTKIGRYVQVHGSIGLNFDSGSASTGNFTVQLPFTAATSSSNQRDTWTFGTYFTSGASPGGLTPAWVVFGGGADCTHYHYDGSAMSSTSADKMDDSQDVYLNFWFIV